MIVFDDVVVHYPRREEPALAGVSLEAPRGRLTAVVGPNGSGKSTLVRALVGRAPLSRGAILIDGVSHTATTRRTLATRVAVVTQREEPAFPLGVRDYVALGRYPHLGLLRGPSRQDRFAVDQAIALTETEHLAARAITELSGGEWQRVRLARAVAQGGDAIVLDEPTTFLDVGHGSDPLLAELLAGDHGHRRRRAFGGERGASGRDDDRCRAGRVPRDTLRGGQRGKQSDQGERTEQHRSKVWSEG